MTQPVIYGLRGVTALWLILAAEAAATADALNAGLCLIAAGVSLHIAETAGARARERIAGRRFDDE